MDRPSPEIVDCPHCGARNFAIDDDCAACRRGLTVFIGPRAQVRRVGLGSVMMGVAVVAVCLAPVRVAPGLCILLACILLPATTRAILHVEGRKAEGRPMIVREKIGAFLNSTAITLVILLAASTAFVATCVPTGYLHPRDLRHEPGRAGHHRRLHRRRGRRTLRHLPAGPATLASQGLTP